MLVRCAICDPQHLAKGAHLIAALAFMFASTNLAIEVAALAFIFLGWQFALALFVGAPIIVAVMAAIVRVTRPEALSQHALHRAREMTQEEDDGSGDLPRPVFTLSAVATGVAIHALFALVGLLPQSAKNVQDLAKFAVDYTLFLNAFAIGVSTILIFLTRRESGREAARAAA